MTSCQKKGHQPISHLKVFFVQTTKSTSKMSITEMNLIRKQSSPFDGWAGERRQKVHDWKTKTSLKWWVNIVNGIEWSGRTLKVRAVSTSNYVQPLLCDHHQITNDSNNCQFPSLQIFQFPHPHATFWLSLISAQICHCQIEQFRARILTKCRRQIILLLEHQFKMLSQWAERRRTINLWFHFEPFSIKI